MKILFICLDYFPYEGACTSLLRKMLYDGHLQQKIGQIDILSVKKKADDGLFDIERGINIHRCMSFNLLSKEDLWKICCANSLHGMVGFFSKAWMKLTEEILGKKLLKKGIMNPVKREIAKLNAESYDAIIPICGYYEAAAVILEYFSELCGKMILYQVDPFATNAKYSGKLAFDAVAYEKELYQKVSAIITTPIICREMLEKYPKEILEKTYEMEFPNIAAEQLVHSTRKSEKICCLFAGNIYATARNPSYTIALFKAISNPNIELHMVGVEREQLLEYATEDAINDITLHGKVPLSEAQDKIRNADMLVNIGNIMTNQVPSKIFEYISACKPIINICANENCPSLPYLEKYPLAKSIVEGVGTLEENARIIEDFICTNVGRTVDQQLVLERFKKCTAEYCASVMLNVIQSVSDKQIM